MDNFIPGWRGRDFVQVRLAQGLPTLSQAAPHLLAQAAPSGPVLLYRAFIEALGSYPKYIPQQIGDCVSFGHGHGNDLLQCVEIAAGEPIEWQETDTEALYGMAREISGGLGTGDGSYGAAAVKAMTQWGLVSRAMLATEGSYSGQRARAWGLSGAPKAVKDMAAGFKLGAVAAVRTWDELVAALANGYPVTECSTFLPNGRRDADGFVGPGGSGGHCQLVVGVRTDRPGACIMNSWPEDFYSGPCGLDCPPYAYWVDRAYVEQILQSGDNWALSKAPSFRPRKWDWSSAA